MRPNASLCSRIRWNILFQLQAIFSTTVFIPIFLLLTTYSLILRRFAKLFAVLFRRDLKQIYNDNGMAFMIENVDVKPKCSLIHLTILEGSLSIDTIRHQFEREILNFYDRDGHAPFARLKHYWTSFMGFYFWKEDASFKVSNHVRVYDYDKPDLYLPTGSLCTLEDLERISGNLLCHPYQKARSPWEMLLLPNYKTTKGKDGVALLLRIHHGLADGFSIVNLILKLLEPETKVPTAKFHQLSLLVCFAQIVITMVRLPWDLATVLFHYGDVPNQWNLHGKKLARSYFAYFSDPVPVARIKEISKRFGASYNAVMYSIGCGVVARMMGDAGHELPSKLSVAIPLPLPNHPGGLVNHINIMQFFVYPKDMDPAGRLSYVSSQVRPARVFLPQAQMAYWLCRVIACFPSYLAKVFLASKLQTLGMSSFCGPSAAPQTIQHTKIDDLIPIFGRPVTYQGGASMVMISFAGKQRIQLVIDKAVLLGQRFPFKLNQYVQEEVEALLSTQDLC